MSKILRFYHNLSLVEKIIIPPMLIVILIIIYWSITFYNTNKIAKFSQTYQQTLIPILEKSLENQAFLKQIIETLSFAAISSETEWIDQTYQHAVKIKNNLHEISLETQYKDLINTKQVLISFNNYFKATVQLTNDVISGKDLLNFTEQTDKVYETHQSVEKEFNILHKNIKEIIYQESQQIKNSIRFLLKNSLLISFIILILLIFISLTVYHDIQKRFQRLIGFASEINDGKPDFKRRLEEFSNDELGTFSKHLNNIFETYEKQYDQLDEEKTQIEEIAKKDQLTTLYNRHFIEETLVKFDKDFFQYEQTYSVILFDIDHFKLVNDTYGHPAGDQVLIDVAQMLKSQSREGDIVGRWGGEEFMILMQGISKAHLQKIAEKFRKSLESLDIETVGKVTASFGVYSVQNGERSDFVIKKADEALYEAKESGRNRVILG